MFNDPVWKINKLEVAEQSGGVVIIHWECTIRDDTDLTIFGTEYGEFGVTPDPEDPNFIPYEDLTQEIVLGWIHSQEGFKEAMEESAMRKAQEKLISPKYRDLPW